MNDAAEPLRRLARERGRILGELGVRVEDTRWARKEADAILGLIDPGLRLPLPDVLPRLIRRIRRVFSTLA